MGEVAAAATSGLLALPDAARLISVRSRHQHRTRGAGRMAAIGASAEEVSPVLAACGSEAGRGLEIAAVNAPASVTVAGPAPLLRRLSEAAAARHWAFVELDLDYAFHSAAMDPVRDGLLAELDGLAAASPRVPLVSTVTGEALAAAECTPSYWWRNLREAVAFLPALRRAVAADGPTLFLEIGPHPVLGGYTRDSLRAGGTGAERATAAVLPTLTRRDTTGDPFPAIADRAFTEGADPRNGPAFAGSATRRGLPPTPFNRKRVWHPASTEARRLTDPVSEHALLGFRDGAEPGRWTRLLDTALEPWLADHRFTGRPVLPAAAMLEIALAAGNARHPEAAAIEIRDFAIQHALPLDAEGTRDLRTELDADGAFALRSRPRLSDEPWTLHATGRVAALPRLPEPADDAPAAAGKVIPRDALLAAAAAGGLDYGPAFQALDTLTVDSAAGIADAKLRRPPTTPPDARFLLHPVRLDGALQGLIGLLADTPAEAGAGLVPMRVARLAWKRGSGPATDARLRLIARGERSAAADLVLRDAAGEALAVVEAVWLERVRLHSSAEAASFRVDLVPALPGPNAEAPDGLDLGPALDAARRRDAALDLDETSALLEGFCAAAAHAALTAAPTATVRTDLARSLLRTLAADGLATPGPAEPRVLPATDLPAALDIWRQVLLEQPALAPDLAWLALAAERLPGALAGDRLALDRSRGRRGRVRSAAGKRRARALGLGPRRGRLRLRRGLAARPPAARAGDRRRHRPAHRPALGRPRRHRIARATPCGGAARPRRPAAPAARNAGGDRAPARDLGPARPGAATGCGGPRGRARHRRGAPRGHGPTLRVAASRGAGRHDAPRRTLAWPRLGFLLRPGSGLVDRAGRLGLARPRRLGGVADGRRLGRALARAARRGALAGRADRRPRASRRRGAGGADPPSRGAVRRDRRDGAARPLGCGVDRTRRHGQQRRPRRRRVRAPRGPPRQSRRGARRRRGRDRRSAGREPRRLRPPGRRGGRQRHRLPPGDARRPAAGRRRPQPPPARGRRPLRAGPRPRQRAPGAPAPTAGHLSEASTGRRRAPPRSGTVARTGRRSGSHAIDDRTPRTAAQAAPAADAATALPAHPAWRCGIQASSTPCTGTRWNR